MEIAPLGQLYIQGRAKHPRQLPVTTTLAGGQEEHAALQTLNGGFSGFLCFKSR
jgi:hypothetical protein